MFNWQHNDDCDASAVTVGSIKIRKHANGLAYTSFDLDIDTAVNKGSIDAEGETLGLYFGMNTGALNISAGAGQGEYEFNTERMDLGSDLTITANDITADVTYFHVGVSGEISRGKLSFSPRVNYRSFDIDMPAFLTVPNDGNSGGAGAGNKSLLPLRSCCYKTYSSNMTEAGLSVLYLQQAN